MNTGPAFLRDIVFTDDLAVRVRHIRPEDAPLLTDFVSRLSLESRRHRFFTAVRELAPDFLRYLTVVDGRDHVALVGVDLSCPEPRFLAVGRFVRCEDDWGAAELAITVSDEVQRKGLGRRLLALLSETARARGVVRFRCEVLRSNHAMRGLLAAHGAAMRSERQGEMCFSLDLPPAAERDPGVRQRDCA